MRRHPDHGIVPENSSPAGGRGFLSNGITPASPPENSSRERILPVFAGFHFGLLQVSSYFLFQCYYTATYLGYFFIAVLWIAGVVLNLRLAKPKSLRSSLIVSSLAYGLLALGLLRFIPDPALLPGYGIL
ncbi:MAG: hypothetical protein ACE5D1_06095, partial [Fidelibacterota bacterium]